MYIKVDKTPNENVLQFTTSQNFPFQGDFRITNQQTSKPAEHPEVVESILNINGVESIFVCDNFMSVLKSEQTLWGEIKPKILLSIVQTLDLGADTKPTQENKKEQYQPKNKLEEEVLHAINQRVKPSIKSHGGDIEFLGIEEDFAKIRLKGACVGCASSSITLKEGVEKMITRFFPTVKGVRET